MKNFQGGVVRKLTSFDDFNCVMKVIEFFPLYEKKSEDELRTMYENLQSNGVIFGYYVENEGCVGIIGIERFEIAEHKTLYAEQNNVIVCITVAVTSLKFRNKGICTKLIQHAIRYYEASDFKCIYIRNNLENSMILDIAKKNGFKSIFDVIETTDYTRIDGKNEKRIWTFWRKELANLKQH